MYYIVVYRDRVLEVVGDAAVDEVDAWVARWGSIDRADAPALEPPHGQRVRSTSRCTSSSARRSDPGRRSPFTCHRRSADDSRVAHVAHPRSLAGPRAAFGQIGAVLGLAVLPALLAIAVIGGAIGHQFAFDFHGAFWQSARDVARGNDPYPPATRAGVARGTVRVSAGDRFRFPAVGVLPFPVAAALITVVLLAAVAGTLAHSTCATGAATGPRTCRSRCSTTCASARSRRCSRSASRSPGAGAERRAVPVPRRREALPVAARRLAARDRPGAGRAARRDLSVLATALAWVAIGFAGLGDYPALLRVLSTAEQSRGYSPVAAGLALGLGPARPRARGRPRGRGPRRLCARAPRRRRRVAGARARRLAHADADRVAALLRAAARADRDRAEDVLMDLAAPALFWITRTRRTSAPYWRIPAASASPRWFSSPSWNAGRRADRRAPTRRRPSWRAPRSSPASSAARRRSRTRGPGRPSRPTTRPVSAASARRRRPCAYARSTATSSCPARRARACGRRAGVVGEPFRASRTMPCTRTSARRRPRRSASCSCSPARPAAALGRACAAGAATRGTRAGCGRCARSAAGACRRSRSRCGSTAGPHASSAARGTPLRRPSGRGSCSGSLPRSSSSPCEGGSPGSSSPCRCLRSPRRSCAWPAGRSSRRTALPARPPRSGSRLRSPPPA